LGARFFVARNAFPGETVVTFFSGAELFEVEFFEAELFAVRVAFFAVVLPSAFFGGLARRVLPARDAFAAGPASGAARETCPVPFFTDVLVAAVFAVPVFFFDAGRDDARVRAELFFIT
jgi:hypothetical protein